MSRVSRVRLRLAGRIAPVLGLLMMLMVPMVGIAQATPSTSLAVQAPADKDPCDMIKGTPGYKYCIEGNEKRGEEESSGGDGGGGGGGGGSSDDEDGDGDPCSSLKDTPGYDYCRGDSNSPLDTITGDCKAAPDVEAPGEGMLGWVDEGPGKNLPATRDPKAANADAYLYEQYGYAGLRWSTYDLGCGGALRDMGAASDNAFANKVFTWSKFWTAATVKLRQYAISENALNALDPVVERATRAVRDAVYSPWIGLSLVALGIVIVLQARKRNLPDVMSQIAWALLVMTLATGVASYPVEASKFADTALNSTVSAIDQAFADVDLNGDGNNKSQDDGGSSSGATQVAYDPAVDPDTPGAPGNPTYPDESTGPAQHTTHGNMLVHSVLYQQWLRGELGDDDSKVAKKYGMVLFDSQALTWRENQLPADARSKVIKEKKQTFEATALKIKEEDQSAYDNLTGTKEGRLGAAFLSNFQSFGSNLFSMVADLIIIGGKIMIKFVVIMFPALAVVGLHRRMQGTVRNGLNAVAAAVVNVPIFATGGAIDVLVVGELADDSVPISPWFKAVLMLLVTYVLWKICKPLTRLSSMLNPNRNWVEDGGAAAGVPARLAKRAAQYYVARRVMRSITGGRGGNNEAVDADDADELPTIDQSQGAPRSSQIDPDADAARGTGGQDRQGNDWWTPQAPNGPAPQGGGAAAAGGPVPLQADYEHDEENVPASAQSLPDTYSVPAHPYPGTYGPDSDGVWPVESSWYVEDLDPAARSASPSSPGHGDFRPAGAYTARSPRHTTLPASSQSLPAPTQPDGPAPLPTGSPRGSASTELPSPRSQGSTGGSSSGYDSPRSLPAPEGALPPTVPQGDRPYVQPDNGPTVVPPSVDEDGGQVFVIFSPTEGYALRDERSHGQDEEGEQS
jgi:uncharacterized membrane protein YgcG